MVRAADAGRRDPLVAGQPRQRLQGEVEGRIGEAVGGIDGEQARPRVLRPGNRIARDLAGADLRAVGRDPRQAVALQAVGFRADQRPGDALRRRFGGAAADEGLGGEVLGVRQGQDRHRLSVP